MTSDEMSREVADLEDYLSEVWDIRKLFHIASVFYCLDGETELSAEDHRATYRKYSRDLDDHLFGAYRSATERTAAVLSKVTKHEGAEVLLARLSDRVQHLVPKEPFQWSWGHLPKDSLDEYIDPEFLQQNTLLTLLGIDIEKQPDRALLTIADHVWMQVHKDVAFYIGKVAAVVDQYITDHTERDTSEPQQNLERIRWIDTASRLAYLFHELEAAGYITPPQRRENGELKPNWSAVARTLHAAFDIRKANGDPVKFTALDAALKLEGDVDKLGGKAAFKITPRRG